MHIVRKEAVCLLGRKLDHHIQHRLLGLIDVLQCHLGCHHRGFRQSHAVIMGKHIPVEFFQIFMEMGAVIEVTDALGCRHDIIVRQTLRLGDKGDHILPETVHPQIQPEPQDLLHFLADQGIVHVQICLLYGKQMHIVFLPHLIPCPGLALKQGIPVVGQLSAPLGRTPDIVIGVRLDPLATLLEPFVFGAGVVYHQVHNDLHAPLMGTVQHLFEGIHTTEFFGNIVIIRNIVAAVHTGGRIQR